MADLIDRQQAVDHFCMSDCGIKFEECPIGACAEIGWIKEVPSADISARVSKALSKEETERFRKAMKNARLGLYPNAEPHSIKLNQGQSSDMISRQAALDALNKYHRVMEHYLPNTFTLMKNDINQLPTAEPQIVRCIDCKFYEGDKSFCRVWDDERSWNDFCSEGES